MPSPDFYERSGERARVERRKLLVQLDPGADVDSEEKKRLGQELRAELAQLDRVQVQPSTSADTPSGGVEAADDWGVLVMTFTAASGVLASVIAAVRNWLGRHDSTHSIRLTIDNDSIDLGRASTSVQESEELISTFERRHSRARYRSPLRPPHPDPPAGPRADPSDWDSSPGWADRAGPGAGPPDRAVREPLRLSRPTKDRERPSIDYDDLVHREFDEKRQPGRLLFNPPDRMQLGHTERVEVRLTRTLKLDAELLRHLRGHGEPRLEEIPTTPLMAVTLKGDGFQITPYSDEEQRVSENQITTWEFDIRALKRGPQLLVMSVSLRIPVPGQTSQRKSIPVCEVTIDVQVGALALVGYFLASNWQWCFTTAIAVAALLTAVLYH
jgi:hypothetical protein